MVEEKYLGMLFHDVQCFWGKKKWNFMLALSGFSLAEMGTVLHRLIVGV